jgi:hypothetical protein
MAKRYCIECGKLLSNYKAIRCHKHANWIITRKFVGKKHTEAQKLKLKKAWDYSKHITDSWRKKQSEVRKGIPVTPKGSKWSEKQRKNILEARNKWSEAFKLETSKKMSDSHTGSKSYSWKGGWTNHRGYVWVLVGKRKYQFEHRLVMEKHLKRKLRKEEQIHHIDGNKKNNNIGNLMLFPNANAHAKYHREVMEYA